MDDGSILWAYAFAKLMGHAGAVAVVDVDYHHGNGTQSIFWERGDLFFTSLHADPHDDYPFFTGHADEVGAGAGLGCNLNLPLPPGTDGAAWLGDGHAVRVVADAG